MAAVGRRRIASSATRPRCPPSVAECQLEPSALRTGTISACQPIRSRPGSRNPACGSLRALRVRATSVSSRAGGNVSPMRALIAILPLFTALQAEPTLSLMPMPAHVSLEQGKLTIDGSFGVRITGHTDRRLHDAVTRFTARLSRQTGIPMAGGARPVLTIECRASSPEVPVLGEDESYQLEIAPSGARLSAPTVTGVLRGLETFSQLVAPDSDSFSVPALRITDRPRFPWRGLSLDVSRHWMPLPVIERNIDAMAAVKMNVFHWHLSDD